MVALDWLSRILGRRLHAAAPVLRAYGSAASEPVASVPTVHAAPPRGGVWECPHCHSRLSDFDLDSG